MAQTVETTTRVMGYDPPAATLGWRPLGLGAIVPGMDLRGLRERLEEDIEGLLGMDFLGRHVIHIDFDRGELLFLKSVPKNAGEAIPMGSEPAGQPNVSNLYVNGERFTFEIDTGFVGLGSGYMEVTGARKLFRTGEFSEVGANRLQTATSGVTCRVFRGRELSLGGFAVDGPVLGETRGNNVLGLGFLSRFAVTFDFPGRTLYLRKGARYGRKDRWQMTGMFTRKRDHEFVIDEIDPGGPMGRAGAKKGDVLVEVGGRPARETSLMELREAQTQAGPVVWVVRRGGEVHRFTVNLPE
jgi:hypothetical protein